MAISFSRYIDIVSGVAAGSSIGVRQLILRLFTDNPLVPPGHGKSFSNAQDVATYFGSASAEYARAAFYFGWVSKNITQAPTISFSRWVDTATGSYIYGNPGSYAVSQFTPITNGGFRLTLGGFTSTLTGINLSSAGSLAAVATAVQTAIRAITANGAAWTGAVVTYDTTRNAFEFTSGTTGTDTIAVVAAPSGTDLAGPLGWLTGAILGNGSAVETLTNTLIASANRTNNFGTFSFIPTLSITQHVEVATWNKTQNVLYHYSVPVLYNNMATWSAALINIGGTSLTLSPIATEFPELIPCAVEAATDYTGLNSVQNFMFQDSFPCTPSVTNDSDANLCDSLRVNYYGASQDAGQQVVFYQRGIMCGLQTDPLDMNTYANEQWLKNDVATSFINLLLSLARISANATGRAQSLSILKGSIKRGLRNGTISPGKTLTDVQQLYITNATGDVNAYFQVEALGYWFDGQMVPFVNAQTGLTEYKFVYILIYSKDDDIRVVDGTHELI